MSVYFIEYLLSAHSAGSMETVNSNGTLSRFGPSAWSQLGKCWCDFTFCAVETATHVADDVE